MLSAFGLSVALVKKGDEWPVRRYKIILKRYFLSKIHRKLPRMLDCIVCTSFWASLVTDFVICLFTRADYWAWPLSGFITLGLTWVVVDFLNSLFKIGKRGMNES